jgi:C-terminal processing protease CtpA/Prc
MSRDFGDGGGGGTQQQQQQQQQLRNSVDHEVEENPELRKEFPNVEGTLFEVWLNKGSRGLGMSIVANRDDHAPGPRGIVIMGIQPGGVADRSKMVMWGDMILEINDTRVIGMTQQDVQEMLMKAASHVRFVMLRQAGGGKALERGAAASVDRDISNLLPQVRVFQLHRDNEKGLGFTVGEAGQGGVITVASITPGGPAEKVSCVRK